MTQFVLDTFQSFWQEQMTAIEQMKSLSDGIDARGRNTGPAHADNIDTDDAIDALLNDKRRNVLGSGREAAEQGQAADANELVQGAIARKIDVVFEHTVSGQQGTIGDDAMIADLAIVGDMAMGHEEIVVPDTRLP